MSSTMYKYVTLCDVWPKYEVGGSCILQNSQDCLNIISLAKENVQEKIACHYVMPFTPSKVVSHMLQSIYGINLLISNILIEGECQLTESKHATNKRVWEKM